MNKNPQTKMKLMISCVLISVFVSSNCVLGANIPEREISSRISDCLFIDNSAEAVELICDNFSEMKSVAGNCYSWLFESESNSDNQMKVKHLKTGQCESKNAARNVAELFPNLSSLDISSFGLEEPINRVHFHFKNLKNLNASYNKMSILDNNMLTSSLIEMDFSHNNIEVIISTTFDSAKSLSKINLSHNSINFLMPSLFQSLTELRVIDLSYNLFTLFDIGVYRNNKKLEVIRIENNRINSLVAINSISFNSLITLNVAGNEINKLNDIFSTNKYYPRLQVLDLSRNPLKEIDVSLLNSFKSLRHLNLSQTELRDFDFRVFVYPVNLETLDLSNNSLEHIKYTSNVGRFYSLRTLNLAGNNLTNLDVITALNFRNLSTIDISRNRIKRESFIQFKNQWSNSSGIVIPDAFEEIFNSFKYLIIAIIGSVLAIVCAIVCAIVSTIICIRRTFLFENEKRSEEMPETSSNHNNNPVYEEPIYAEIQSIEEKYDHLACADLQPSPLQSHYDNATLSMES